AIFMPLRSVSRATSTGSSPFASGCPVPQAPKHCVLVVDDDDDIRYSLRNLLVVYDFDVLLAADGVEALKILDRQPVCAVVIHLMMPSLDGVGVVRARLSKPESERPPVVIVVSAHVELRRRMMGVRIRRVLPKPFDPLELVDELVAAFADPQCVHSRAA